MRNKESKRIWLRLTAVEVSWEPVAIENLYPSLGLPEVMSNKESWGHKREGFLSTTSAWNQYSSLLLGQVAGSHEEHTIWGV